MERRDLLARRMRRSGRAPFCHRSAALHEGHGKRLIAVGENAWQPRIESAVGRRRNSRARYKTERDAQQAVTSNEGRATSGFQPGTGDLVANEQLLFRTQLPAAIGQL
jgi:hypothetical protein